MSAVCRWKAALVVSMASGIFGSGLFRFKNGEGAARDHRWRIKGGLAMRKVAYLALVKIKKVWGRRDRGTFLFFRPDGAGIVMRVGLLR